MLDEEQRDILAKDRETKEELARQAEEFKAKGLDEVQDVAELIKAGGIDLKGQEKAQDESLTLRTLYHKEDLELTGKHYEELIRAYKEHGERERVMIESANYQLLNTIRGFTPLWYDAGSRLMENLIAGLEAYMAQLRSTVSGIQSMLASIYQSGSVGSVEIPVYGKGGVVTSPHMAIVGDVPEAIIPLSELSSMMDEIMSGALNHQIPMWGIQSLASSGNTYNYYTDSNNVEQTVNINQPVKSPIETARELKRVSRGLAERF